MLKAVYSEAALISGNTVLYSRSNADCLKSHTFVKALLEIGCLRNRIHCCGLTQPQ